MGRSWRTVRTGSQFLNLETIGSKVLKHVIKEVVATEYKGKPQLVARLDNGDMSVSINTTSCKLLEKAWGEDFDGWAGKKVKISKGASKFGSQNVPCILVSPA